MWVPAVPNIWTPLGAKMLLQGESQVCMGSRAVPQASAALQTHGIGQKKVRIKDRQHPELYDSVSVLSFTVYFSFWAAAPLCLRTTLYYT